MLVVFCIFIAIDCSLDKSLLFQSPINTWGKLRMVSVAAGNFIAFGLGRPGVDGFNGLHYRLRGLAFEASYVWGKRFLLCSYLCLSSFRFLVERSPQRATLRDRTAGEALGCQVRFNGTQEMKNLRKTLIPRTGTSSETLEANSDKRKAIYRRLASFKV